MCMYMCPTLNSFRDRAISMYSWKIVAKGMLCIVSNIGIYCSSDKVGIFYPVQYIIQNSTVNSHALLQIVQEHGVLLVWVHHNFYLCCRYHPLFDRTICLGYPLLFCALHPSSNPINKNLKGRSRSKWRTILVAKSKLLYSEIDFS